MHANDNRPMLYLPDDCPETPVQALDAAQALARRAWDTVSDDAPAVALIGIGRALGYLAVGLAVVGGAALAGHVALTLALPGVTP